MAAPLKQIVLTAGTSWTVPADWNNENNRIECIGASAPNGTQNGFGGGAYASNTNVVLSPGAVANYQVGYSHVYLNRVDTWFGSAALLCAKGSKSNLGGQASASTGLVRYSGGNGANESSTFYGAGGGAAGPRGNGGAANGLNGGTANAGYGGYGGSVGYSSSNGTMGSEWGTVGSGGGGGAPSKETGNPGGLGGNYGGGAGGASQYGGQALGGAGLIVITYGPAEALPKPLLGTIDGPTFSGNSGTLSAKASLSGSSAFATASTSQIQGNAPMEGQARTSFTAVASGSLCAVLQGASTLRVAALATLSAVGFLAGSTSLDYASLATLKDTSGVVTGIKGNGTLHIVNQGKLDYTHGIAGAVHLQLLNQGSLALAAALSGSSHWQTNFNAMLGGELSLRGVSSTAFALTGSLSKQVSIRGFANLGTAAKGTLSAAVRIAGTAGLRFALTGTAVVFIDRAGNLRELFLAVYAARQTLLNAIDASNRSLADGAKNQASANAVALQTLDTSVTALGGVVTAQAQSLTNLRADVNNVSSGLSAQAGALNQLYVRVNASEGRLDTQADSLTTLTTRLTDLNTALTGQTTTTNNLSSRVTTAEGKITTQGVSITNLNSQVSNLNGSVGGQANALSSLTTTVSNHQGVIDAHSTSINSINASVGNNTSAISSEATTRSSQITAASNSITALTTSVNGHTATITNQQTSINGVMAKAGISLDVNGYVTGWALNNNGQAGSMVVRADAFAIQDPAGNGRFLQYADGNLTISGNLAASMITASAMEMASTRIHTGGGRLAPFVVRDSVFVNNGLGHNNQTLTLSDFINPDYGSGFNWKRLGGGRMDVYIESLAVCDSGDPNSANETIFMEAQYNGGAWESITSLTCPATYRTPSPLYIRYTTADVWNTLAFRVRSVNGRIMSLSLKVEVLNFNTSGNAPRSQSGIAGAVSAPPPPSGGYCVDWETTVLPDGRYVRDLIPGDLVECVDVMTGERTWVSLARMEVAFAECAHVWTEHGQIIQSLSTPMNMRDGSVLYTPELAGKELLTHAHGWERAEVSYVSSRKVCMPDFGNRMFFAGMNPHETIATHNMRDKIPPP